MMRGSQVRDGGPVRRPTAYKASAAIGRRLTIATILVVGIALAVFYRRDEGPTSVSASRAAATSVQTFSARFSICGGGPRIDCVVDGDTFWIGGEKVRIADIDAPEISPPRCQHEADLGEAAKQRLLVLLNVGPFTLIADARDRDRFGRKLRTVSRGGRSIGDTLIAEGLARRWGGPRRSWCD